MSDYTLSEWMLQDINVADILADVTDRGVPLTTSVFYASLGACSKTGECGSCEGGTCQSSTSNSCTTSGELCSEGCGCRSCIACQSCELDCKSCNSSCESSCCQSGCNTSCESSCCEGSCNTSCESSCCQSGCNTSCESSCCQSGCNTYCESSCCQSGCNTSCESSCCQGVCNTGCQVYCRCSDQGGQCTCSNQGKICQTCQSFCEVGKEELYKHIDQGNQFVYIQPIDTTAQMLEDDADWNALTTFITKGIAVYDKYKKYDTATMTHTTNVSPVVQDKLMDHNSTNTVNKAINEFINCATGITDKASGSLSLQNDMILFKTNMNKAKISKKVPCCQNTSYQDCISQQN